LRVIPPLTARDQPLLGLGLFSFLTSGRAIVPDNTRRKTDKIKIACGIGFNLLKRQQ
jgi:hypothetical protein